MGLALSPPIHIIQYYIVFGTGVYQVVAIYVSVALWLHNVLLFTWVSPSGCTSSCLEQAWNRLEQAWNRLGTSLEQGPQAWNKVGTSLEQAWNRLEQVGT